MEIGLDGQDDTRISQFVSDEERDSPFEDRRIGTHEISSPSFDPDDTGFHKSLTRLNRLL